MISKRARKVVAGVLLALLLAVSFSLISSNVDYRRVDNGKRPWFSFAGTTFEDGGTTLWYGFGYTLWSMHSIATSDDRGATGFVVGPKLEYWIPVWPFRNKENTQYAPHKRQDGGAAS